MAWKMALAKGMTGGLDEKFCETVDNKYLKENSVRYRFLSTGVR